MFVNEIFHARPDLDHGNAVQTKRIGETAIIGTGFIGAGAAFKNLRGRM